MPGEDPPAGPATAEGPSSTHAGGRSARVLVIEDEPKTALYLQQGLSEQGFHVETVGDGVLGLRRARTGDADLIILDMGLPHLDGGSLLQELRAEGNLIPVLILTARDQISDRVAGLERGADDYLIKPFAFSELLARIRTVLRRGRGRMPTSLQLGDLTLDLGTRKANRAGRRLELSPTEFALLATLVRNAPAPVSRRFLAEQVWEMRFDSNTNVVEVAVKRLRAKVDDPFPTKLIQTVRGVGYACCEP